MRNEANFSLNYQTGTSSWSALNKFQAGKVLRARLPVQVYDDIAAIAELMSSLPVLLIGLHSPF